MEALPALTREEYLQLPVTDRPLAAHPYTSYRCRGAYGWIMIGAHDHDGAMREALRSSPHAKRETLQVWNGRQYVPV